MRAPPLRRRQHRWKRAWSCRCWTRGCRLYGHRFIRALRPAEYSHRQRRHGCCPACKRELAIDRYRSSGREAKASGCRCGGYPWKHRKGSLFCAHGAAGAQGYAWMGDGSALAWRESVGQMDRAVTA